MGWLWNSSDESKDQLDPSLREFLATEAPTGEKPYLPPRPKPQAQPESTEQTPESETPAAPVVPPQSQFQDGRYAHLWKNYVPQNELEDRGKTEQDKLRDIVDAYNDRRAEIGRAAMENCALEYLDQFDCFKSPGMWQMATLCRAETRKFNRCYEMQSKFLKALGYLSMDQRTREQDEEIQMHADKLYQSMLEQEAAMEKAREEGREMPQFESVMSKKNITRAMAGKGPAPAQPVPATTETTQDDESDVWSRIKPEARKQYEEKIAQLPPSEQEIERSALVAELRTQQAIAKKVEVTFVEERINRMKRREAGQATIGDTIKRWWGWD